jgi:isoleucyl-tRNA synthetase
VLTHGFVLDEKGHKMSKSLGNVVDPYQIINGGKNQKQEPAYGADVLRLWVASVDYANDVPIGQGILKQLVDIRNKIRNTARFLLGNLHDFNPETDAVAYEDLPELDRYMLHRMTEVFTEVTEAYESFQFFKFFQTVQNFCVVDLSNFYLDIAKDRLYISAPNAPRRRSCQTILQLALENLTKAIAPVLCHLAEDIWQFLPYEKPTESVFQSGWVNLDAQWQQPQLAQKWVSLRQLRDGINQLLEQARRDKVIGSSLEAKLIIVDPRTAESGTDEKQGENFVHWFYGWLENFNEPTFDPNDRKISLRNIFLTSQVEFIKSAEIEPSFTYEETVVINLERHDNNIRTKPIKIIVTKADGHKCERCWNYSTQVGSFSDDPTICERCNEALQGNF